MKIEVTRNSNGLPIVRWQQTVPYDSNNKHNIYVFIGFGTGLFMGTLSGLSLGGGGFFFGLILVLAGMFGGHFYYLLENEWPLILAINVHARPADCLAFIELQSPMTSNIGADFAYSGGALNYRKAEETLLRIDANAITSFSIDVADDWFPHNYPGLATFYVIVASMSDGKAHPVAVHFGGRGRLNELRAVFTQEFIGKRPAAGWGGGSKNAPRRGHDNTSPRGNEETRRRGDDDDVI